MKASTEVTADITLTVQGTEYTLKSVDTSKEISMAEIRGNNIKLEGAPTTAIDYSGTMTFHGNKKTHFDSVLFDGKGIPIEGTITITHKDGTSSGYARVKVTSEGYSAEEENASETTYDWMAHDEL